jgi:iron(III) transport system substrate-binding protein
LTYERIELREDHMNLAIRPMAFTVAILASSAIGVAQDAPPGWIIPEILPAARAEGQVTVYSSTNEQEGLPLWRIFEAATGVKVNYVRAADAQLMGKIAIEARTSQNAWDLINTPTANQLPAAVTLPFDPPEARNVMASARDPKRRWYGVYANYNSPAYNTKLVQKSELPKSYEEFLTKKDWVGRVAIEGTDNEWMNAMFAQYGREKGRKLMEDIASTLKVVVLDGHLAAARQVASGEYAVALNNYTMLTNNMKLSGAPTDFWALDPVALFFGQVSVNAHAPHPNAALLAANFMLSRQAQEFAAKTGRIPTRSDVTPNPPDVVSRLSAAKVVPYALSGEEIKASQKTFDEIFKKH